jgi:ferredoxin-NADP reductase
MDDHDPSAHKDLRCSQITQSEEDTVKVMQTVRNFVDFFEVENKNVLYCLFSGTMAPNEVENYLRSVDTTGQAAYMQFIREQLLERRVNFNVPIKKLKLKTFTKIAKTVKVATKSKKTKHTIVERNFFS